MNTKKKKLHNLKPRYYFNTSFEERKTLCYLNNLIKSAFLHRKTNELLNLAISLLGQKRIIAAMRMVCPEFLESEDFRIWIEHDIDVTELSPKTRRELLVREISAALTQRIAALASDRNTILERRLKMIQESFKLNTVEIELLTFFFLKETVPVIDCPFSNDRHEIADFGSIPRLRSHGNSVLGVNRAAFLRAFTEGNIFRSQVLERSGNNSISLPGWCRDYLFGLGPENLSTEFYCTENSASLEAGDFDITGDELSVLDAVIKSREGKNILLYGAPGAGKTSFAATLAKRYQKELLSVKVPESGEHNDRIRALYATINRADKNRSLMLVDEADEILNTFNSSAFKSVTFKSWINMFLDTHGKKVIWITNRSDNVDPSTMRRFSFSLEFRKFDHAKRIKVLKYELEKKGIEKGYFSSEELKELCMSYSVDAGGIVNAVRTAAPAKTAKKETVIRQIKTILKSHERATSGKNATNMRVRSFDSYTLQGLNTSYDLTGIISGLQQYAGSHAASCNAVSLLLYGMPGTGKTEFVYYLGHVLRKEVVMKRASEIQSMWVGETEKNVARAFSEAGENGAILFFDEADSFLFPRKDALRSWEKSHTNEILTQLENFKGIVVFATNDIDGLDHAALRRFRFKVHFDPLTPEGNLHFYNLIMLPLVTNNQALARDDTDRLKGIPNLTPGDYSVVKDQFTFMGRAKITHDMLITALMGEAMHKRRMGLSIGF